MHAIGKTAPLLAVFIVLLALSVVSCSGKGQDSGVTADEASRHGDNKGTVLWEKPIKGQTGAFPFADEDNAYLGLCRSGKTEVEALRLDDGERVWRITLPYSCLHDRLRIAASPLEGAGETLLVSIDDIGLFSRAAVVALNKADGSIKWEFKGRRISLGKWFPYLNINAENSAILWIGPNAKTAYVQFGASRLVALDIETGSVKWQISLGYDRPSFTHLRPVGKRVYWGITGLPLRVLDAESGSDLPPPPFPEFVDSRMKLWDHWDRGWYTIGDEGLFFRIEAEEGFQLIGLDLQSGRQMWAIEGEVFYPKYVSGGKLYTPYRPPGVSPGWSLVNERLWIASVDEKTGNIDWHVPYKGKNASVFWQRRGPHLLVVDRTQGAQVHRVDDGSLVWISTDNESADTLDAGGTRLLHIANGRVSLISLE